MIKFGDDLINAMTEVLRMTDLDKLIEAVEGGAESSHVDFFVPLDHLTDDGDLGLTARSAYNGSLDAAKALHEALLPGWPVRVMDHSQEYLGAHGWHACVNWPHMDAPKGKATYPANSYSYTAWNQNPARAWLIAILKAYRSTL